MPSDLLRRWSGFRAPWGLPGSELTLQPRARIADKTGGQRQSCATTYTRSLCLADTEQIQVARVRVWLHPAPCASWRGPKREVGGGRARAVERPGAREAGGGREGGGGTRRRASPRPSPSEPPTSPWNFLV